MTSTTDSLDETYSFSVTGMSCAGCASGLEKRLKNVPGIADAIVNFALERATVHIKDRAMTREEVFAAVGEAGYQASMREGADAARNRDEDRLLAWLTLMAAVLSLPLLAKMLVPQGHALAISGWTEMMLALPIQFVAGWRFYKGAWASVSRLSAGMDLLVAIGTSAAFFYSLAQLLLPQAQGHLYFETAAVVITLVLFGRLLEERAKRKTTEAIRLLMALRPEEALVMRDGGAVKVPVEFVRVGETVKVLAGERIPVDGQVVQGQSELDESMLTGESLPVVRAENDPVYAGTVNGAGILRIEVAAVSADSRLARIVRTVVDAQQGKAPVQRLVDKVSSVFVPVVLLVALLALLGWMLAGAPLEQALLAAVSVLVIACPCALGLATPTAIVTGMGAAAQAGILFRDIEALERIHAVDLVVFDKTGTLTEGRPRISAVTALNGWDVARVLEMAAALQKENTHPLGKAFIAEAEQRKLVPPQAEQAEQIAGFGIVGMIGGHRMMIGNMALMKREGISADGFAGAEPSESGHTGTTRVYLAVDGVAMAVADLMDQPREEARAMIAALNEAGMETQMISGDRQGTAEAVAGRLGIANVLAEVLPEGKAQELERLRARGRCVAMVGDGINDAPALAAADVGIAIGGGSDIAVETAPVTLMRPDLRLLPAVMDISRRVIWKIRQNLFWAFIFNIIGIPLAAFGLLNPMIAGAAMALSSVTVVSNSLLLKGWCPVLQTPGKAEEKS